MRGASTPWPLLRQAACLASAVVVGANVARNIRIVCRARRGVLETMDKNRSWPSTDSGPLELRVARLTDTGLVRPHNEDYMGSYIPPDPQRLARKGAIYLVADGMGGHNAGESASQGAVELVMEHYYADTTQDPGISLIRAFQAANHHLYEQARADPSKAGMGTTLVAAVILGRKAYVANVGDSRAYLVNGKGIIQITEDHSWVAEWERAGQLTPDQARRHPHCNLVTRALGSRPSVEVDLFEGGWGAGDTLLLCTDGLTGPVGDGEIEAIVRAHPPEEAARLLVARANERGGSDNVSVLIVATREEASPLAPEDAFRPEEEAPSPAEYLVVAIGAVASMVLIALMFLLAH
jgi:serine/threonine protein phosphatase PrpC